MTYAEATVYLQSLGQFGMVLGLERIQQLSQLAGNPHQDLKFIHVAGTNGKGSTCAFLESIFRMAGFRTALYTSPHLVSFTERIQINRQNISEEQVIAGVLRLKPLAESLGSNNQPTFFEFVTLMALCHFADQKPDIVIWETGLGGRLDATNIVTPLLSVITNIQLDHENWLGRTLPKIAFEKAGIIKPQIPVLIGPVSEDVHQVIEEVAKINQAPLNVCQPERLESQVWFRELRLPLIGRFQRYNAALAVQAVFELNQKYHVEQKHLETGLRNTVWWGRLQIVTTQNGRQILLDGAHNPAGVRSLCEAVREEFGDQQITVILGILQDKEWRIMARELAAVAIRIITVSVPNSRTVPAIQLSEFLQPIFPNCSIVPVGSMAEALAATVDSPLTLVAGSLYLIGETIAILQGIPAHHELNQWIDRR